MKKEIRAQLEPQKQLKNSTNIKWILQLATLAFSISFAFAFAAEVALQRADLLISCLAVIACIGIAVIFDIFAIAITTADEAPFHSMSAQKIHAARVAVKLKKNAAKLSSIFGDVIGDILGIISGTAGVYIAVEISGMWDLSLFICSLVSTAVIGTLTITAKALEKNFALQKNNFILYYIAGIIGVFYKPN